MKRTICALFARILTLSCIGVVSFAGDVPANDFPTEAQYEYILRSAEDLNAIYDYADGEYDKSIPDPIVCAFWDDGIEDSDSYVFQKSATPDFAECETIADVPYKECELYNLYLGEHFYWRAGTDLESIADSPVHELTVTTQVPRNCYVPGVTNVRDIGGYESSLVPGAKIRQGLYYRGALINGMTREGLDVLYDQLGVRAEIDLRDADRGRTYLRGLDRIAYYNAPIANNDYFTDYPEQFKLVYEVISNAAEAPVYLHCQAGADRTGISTFMLLTVCGVSYHDAAFDYLFTCFSTMGLRSLPVVEGYYERLNSFEGETKAEQAKNWIMSQGVSEYTVEKIRETFVEGYESEYLKGFTRQVALDGEKTLYTTGGAPSFTGAVPDGALYSLASLEWRGDDGTSFTSDAEKNAELEKDGTLIAEFKGGVRYSLCASFTAPEGAPFAEDLKLYVDNERLADALFTLSDDGMTATFEGVASFFDETPHDHFVPGDTNGDGAVNAKDVVALMKAIVKGIAAELFAGDFNKDGAVNAKDVVALMKAIVKAATAGTSAD